MKCLYINSILLIIFISSDLLSQEFINVYPPESNGAITSLVFDDEGNGYGSLTCDLLITSDDMGVNWDEISLDFESKNLHIIPNTSGNEILSQNINFLYYSADRGQNWENITPPGAAILDHVVVTNNQNIFAVGRDDLIYKSTDRGSSWTVTSSGLSSGGQITFFDEMHGWAGPNSGHLSSTTDGGITWNPIYILDDANNYFTTTFISLQIGYRSSSSKLFKTINGGSTWELVYEGQNFYSSFKAFDENTIYSYSGAIHSFSTDGGMSWTSSTRLPNANESRCFALSPAQIWRYGLNKSILFTTNIGTSFTRLSGEFIHAINDIEFIDELNGIAVTEGGTMLQTQDGGRNWTRLSTTFNGKIHGVTYSPDGSLLIAGNGVGIRKSTDNGSSFTLIYTASFSAPKFQTSPEGTIYLHDSKEILVSTNNGSSWTLIYSTPTATTRNFAAPSDDALYVVGNNGFMTKSTDQGVSWTDIDLGTTSSPLELYFDSENQGVVISNDSIRWTSDGGQSFEAVSGRILPSVRQIIMDDVLNGLAVQSSFGSSFARILKTTDGWRTALPIHTTCQGLQTITRNPDTEEFWFAGEGYNIKTTDPTITSVFNIGHTSLKKLLVYPNPTSQFLTIELPELNFPAKLSLFDSSLKKIHHQLLNDPLKEVKLNLSQFINGLYTLTLIDGQEKYVQKIVLNK